MRHAGRCSTILICLILAQVAYATEVEEVLLDKLPPNVLHMAAKWSRKVEVVAAKREREDGKECYLVTVIEKGERYDLYVAPDGKFAGRKEDDLSAVDIPKLLLVVFIVSIFPCAIGAAGGRFFVWVLLADKCPILLRWIVEWIVAALMFAILWWMIAKVGPPPDAIEVVSECTIVGGISASIFEVAALAVQSIRGRRTVSLGWVFAFCVLIIAPLCLSIPWANRSTERRNRYYRNFALRPPPTENAEQ